MNDDEEDETDTCQQNNIEDDDDDEVLTHAGLLRPNTEDTMLFVVHCNRQQ